MNTASWNGKNRGIALTEEKPGKVGQLIVGGLHRDDFEWAVQQYEEIGYVLVAFLVDYDGYHWKAVYVKAHNLDSYGGRGSLCVCVSLYLRRCT